MWPRIPSLLLAVLLLASACNSAKRAYENGRYEEAVALSAERLRDKPDDRDARRLLVAAYDKAVEANLVEIEDVSRTQDPFRHEVVARSYERLNTLYHRLDRCPACDEVLPRRRLYSDELAQARTRAAEHRYALGVAKLEGRDRESAKEAIEHFMVVEQMVPDFRDTRARMDEAYARATLYVVVEPMAETQRDLREAQGDFQQRVLESLDSRRMNEYVRFLTVEEVERERPPYVDHRIQLQFESFTIGNVLLESHTETVTSADSVRIGEARLPDGTRVPVFDKVTAQLTRYRKRVVSGGALQVRITDETTGRVILQERHPGEFIWEHRWATFNGDQRALNQAQRELAAQRDIPPPPPEVLFDSFTRPIQERLNERLRRFYARY